MSPEPRSRATERSVPHSEETSTRNNKLSGRSERAGNSGDMKQITEIRRAKVMDALKRKK